MMMMDRLPTMTVTLPAFPLLFDSASVVMPVRKSELAFAPSMVSVPATFTDRLPALPDPNVPLEI
jgi:hypothetical protein